LELLLGFNTSLRIFQHEQNSRSIQNTRPIRKAMAQVFNATSLSKLEVSRLQQRLADAQNQIHIAQGQILQAQHCLHRKRKGSVWELFAGSSSIMVWFQFGMLLKSHDSHR
jgi:hypothetical protein